MAKQWTTEQRQVTDQIKDLLETSFPNVWIEGEISNFSRPRSGHCYLTLKDDEAQLPAVIWRSTASRLRFDLHDGLEVVCLGQDDVGELGVRCLVHRLVWIGLVVVQLAGDQKPGTLAGTGLAESPAIAGAKYSIS